MDTMDNAQFWTLSRTVTQTYITLHFVIHLVVYYNLYLHSHFLVSYTRFPVISVLEWHLMR